MRPIWTGAISFGLIHIPVKFYSAVIERSLDLDMLRKEGPLSDPLRPRLSGYGGGGSLGGHRQGIRIQEG